MFDAPNEIVAAPRAPVQRKRPRSVPLMNVSQVESLRRATARAGRQKTIARGRWLDRPPPRDCWGESETRPPNAERPRRIHTADIFPKASRRAAIPPTAARDRSRFWPVHQSKGP